MGAAIKRGAGFAGLCFLGLHLAASPAAAVDFSSPAAPAGIRIEALGNMPVDEAGLAYTGTFLNVKNARGMAFANAEGHTLYTFEGDKEPGKSACSGECAAKWPPAVAAANAAPVGDWTIITRADGVQQWAFKGKPLYASVTDKVVGDYNGITDQPEWRLAAFVPPTQSVFPNRISIRQVKDAGGQVLIDPAEKTIYAFDGDASKDGLTCATPACFAATWIPVPAPAIAKPFGDFSIVERADASKQWAYKGKPLYTFAKDVEINSVLGAGVDPRWSPALVVRYNGASGANIRPAHITGHVLTTPDGKALYRQQVYYYSVSSHDLPRAVPYTPIVARAVGAKGCVGKCTSEFVPFAAPADAQPEGFWNVLTRDDGSKQWAYNGYALYTYVGDKKPGDMRGLNIWDLSINDPSLGMVSDLTSLKINAEGMSAIFWTAAYP